MPSADDPLSMLRAIAHPTRLGMLRQLAATPETCACDFTELFAVRQPTISQHLKVLREAGLVRTRREGTKICYSVRPEAVARLAELVQSLQPPAQDPLAAPPSPGPGTRSRSRATASHGA
ncbi:ArsR family transcriptional regulator [Catenulispora sp. GP43]|uniref:ArsR/SmtB family transcription factor n=1 Tax=Catenulispora sp. GP43 TaxID=3156263 RepID=UPI003514D2DC